MKTRSPPGHVSAGERKEGPEHPSGLHSPSSRCTAWVSVWCPCLRGPALIALKAGGLCPVSTPLSLCFVLPDPRSFGGSACWAGIPQAFVKTRETEIQRGPTAVGEAGGSGCCGLDLKAAGRRVLVPCPSPDSLRHPRPFLRPRVLSSTSKCASLPR